MSLILCNVTECLRKTNSVFRENNAPKNKYIPILNDHLKETGKKLKKK